MTAEELQQLKDIVRPIAEKRGVVRRDGYRLSAGGRIIVA